MALNTEQMAEKIEKECDEIKRMLLAKNESYGNAAADPIWIFSSTNALEGINIRIDDKLSRLSRGRQYQQEDTIKDLIGYLILKRVVASIPTVAPAAPAGGPAS